MLVNQMGSILDLERMMSEHEDARRVDADKMNKKYDKILENHEGIFQVFITLLRMRLRSLTSD